MSRGSTPLTETRENIMRQFRRMIIPGICYAIVSLLIAATSPAAEKFEIEIKTAVQYGTGGGESAWLRDANGGSVYLRLSTRPVEQPEREMSEALREGVITGGYWLAEPAPGAELAIVFTGAVAPEAVEAHRQILEDVPGAGLLAVTSADRLNAGWHAAGRARQEGVRDARAHIERLLAPLAPDAGIVTVIDGHPAALGWLGSVRGHRVYPLGVEHFGQSGDLPDLYRACRLDVDAIVEAGAAACLERLGG